MVTNDNTGHLVSVRHLLLAADFERHKKIDHTRLFMAPTLYVFRLTHKDSLVAAYELDLLDGVIDSFVHLVLFVDLSDVFEVGFLPLDFTAIFQIAHINVGTGHDHAPVNSSAVT